MLTNKVVNFEQPAPGQQFFSHFGTEPGYLLELWEPLSVLLKGTLQQSWVSLRSPKLYHWATADPKARALGGAW